MSKHLTRYFWDSSIFLMLLKGEICHGEEALEAAKDILRKVEQCDAIIVASEIVVAEVLAFHYDAEIYDKWEACLQWENLQLRAVDHPIAIRASKLRSECLKQQPKVRIKMADAIHVATFLVYSDNVDQLHSVDPDFAKALEYSGETRKACVPYRLQTELTFHADEIIAEEDESDDLEADDNDGNYE